jgi:hypothetical protein
LWSIAEALGRPRAALQYLARTSPHGGAEELLLGTAAARDGDPDLARDWPDERLWDSKSSADGSFVADEILEAYAADVFIKGGGLAALMIDGDTLRGDAVEALTRIAGMWPGLTEDRRAAVVRYVDEQSILSEIDRKKRA